MKEALFQFVINITASIIGTSIAIWFSRRWQKETSEQIKKLKLSLKYYIKKYGEKDGT